MPMTRGLRLWSAVVCVATLLVGAFPSAVVAQMQRAEITLVTGRTVQIAKPMLMEQTNPGWTPAYYLPAADVVFSKVEKKDLRWNTIVRLDYYPVDKGANCAAVIRFRDGTILGIKYQLVFDSSDDEIIRQLPTDVIVSLRSATWRLDLKPFTAPAGLHHLRPFGASDDPSVWDLFQCAYFREKDGRKHRIQTIAFR